MSADDRLDAAIALARKLAQDPRCEGSDIAVDASWESGRPSCLNGKLSIHVDEGTPAEAWAALVAPAPVRPLAYTHEGRATRCWRVEVDGVEVSVYVHGPKEAPCAPAA